MPTAVSDVRSNPNDQIAHAARAVGRGRARRLVFEAICSGKKRIKTVGEIADKTGLARKQVLDAAKPLVHKQLLHQVKHNGDTAYEKDDFYAGEKKAILAYGADPAKLAKLPTKTNPVGRQRVVVERLKVPKSVLDVQHITVDDVASLSKVRPVRRRGMANVKIAEKDFKAGFQRILGEEGEFKDWGGEKNDLWTTQLKVKAKRVRAAVAFKGPGQRGKLTPRKLGKNGDQIQRLFDSDADVYLVQYWEQVDQAVYEQMKAFAVATSVAAGGRTVWWGVIDGTDSARLIAAYPTAFQRKDKT